MQGSQRGVFPGVAASLLVLHRVPTSSIQYLAAASVCHTAQNTGHVGLLKHRSLSLAPPSL